MLDYLARAEVGNIGLVYTVYHDLRQGMETDLLENLAAAAGRIDFLAVDGPDLIRRHESDNDLYVRLFQVLQQKDFDGGFLIYSRKFEEPAEVYLHRQMEAFKCFRTKATKPR
jgi:hypothetical protein